MKSKVTLFWFRRDLRLNDNHGFYNALMSSESVLPIFIYDQNILDKLPKHDSNVILVESDKVPSVGAGEGTTPHMIFLLRFLGIDLNEFFKKT